ncbi:uncharacterized protein Z518_05700 [Rhinocladiella mackenziei CBS 650.93]|uniref:Rhinocladiella mackenziei CBS 650.93 unplaced genomic scaffold supercont1.4, whole genome shotgun sequence n=1 Tax=Rhinocladiella mackenziei CBS 650.93 TaxID=1442369 RepID=A0A0D2IGB8_9EURO|nr:uncharacterized protein Z518_05700 [Rhinocladiella mackenziei CBS 650.93]KIX04829.1 hypothetical protein Z518_05700 [Rhinocladiella mackenziei CBS 650.93]
MVSLRAYALPNVTLKVNSKVVDVDMDTPSVTLSDGSTLVSDLIVGADGVKSTCRRLLYQRLGLSDKARPTGDAAFRVMIPLEFVKTPVATRWLSAILIPSAPWNRGATCIIQCMSSRPPHLPAFTDFRTQATIRCAGSAQAVEDAAVLNLALNNVSATRSISTMLKAYKLSRKKRAESTSNNASTTRLVLHYPDGPEQRNRDEKFRAVARGGENPDVL